MPTGTPITQSGLGALLKNLYASWEIEQLVNLESPVLAQCAAKGSAQLGGTGFFFPVRVASGEGHAFISESANIPTSVGTTVLQAEVDPKIHAGVAELTGLAMATSQGDAMSFAKGFDENVSQLISAMTAYKEGTLFRDGTGVLAAFSGNPDADAGPHDMDDVAFIRPGMNLHITDSSGDTRESQTSVAVSAVDWVNKTITTAASLHANTADTDLVFMANSQNGTGSAIDSLEYEGLTKSVATGNTYLGINRATAANAKWKGLTITASGFLDEALLLQARTRITQESGIPLSGISRRFKVVCHPQQVDVLFKLAISRIRYSGNDKFDLGNSDEVYFGNMPFVTSYLCPPTDAYMGDWSYHQCLYVPGGELHIDTEYNGASLKWVSDKDIGVVFLKEYANFALRRPNAMLRFSSLSVPSR